MELSGIFENKSNALKSILDIKQLEHTESNLNAIEQNLKWAYEKIYHAVCLDIDDTLIDSAGKFTCDMINQLAKLSKYNNILCFITGRGENRTRDYLHELMDKIKEEHKHIDKDCFKRWYAIVNNGILLLKTEDKISGGFLRKKENLVDKKVIVTLKNNKDKLRRLIAGKLSEFAGDYNTIIDLSKKHGGELSLRFPFNDETLDKEYDSRITKEIECILRLDKDFNIFTVTKGTYNGSSGRLRVFEVVMTNKGRALESFEKLIGIPEKSMLRIGDQGDHYGNDYDMLNSECGFSAGNVSQNISGCFPILNEQYNQLTGSIAVTHLLSKVRVNPAICLEKNDQSAYKNKMATIEMEARAYTRKTLLKYVSRIPHLHSNESETQLNDIIDILNGAIFFMDCEWAFLESNLQKHSISRLFMRKTDEERPQPCYSYACQTDEGILLRGPLLYYYGLCAKKDEAEIDKELFDQWLFKSKEFIQLSEYEIRKAIENDGFNVNNFYDRKLILGVIDNIRNILLLWYNICLESAVQGRCVLLRLESPDPEVKVVKKCFDLVKENSEFMFRAFFGEIYAFNIRDYLYFIIQKIEPFCQLLITEISPIFTTSSATSYNKALRVWREIDSYFENIVAVDIAMQQYIDSIDNFRFSTLFFHAVRYGGIELPILAEIVCRLRYNIKENIFQRVLSSNLNYIEKQNFDSTHPVVLDEVSAKVDEPGVHILFDDNLATGKTLQMFLNGMVCNNIYTDGITIVRYPTLNRLEQMFDTDSSAAPDLSLFFCLVRGLVTPSPYTRLNKRGVFDQNPINVYLDELGVFDLARQRIKEYLYKNGCYINGSEVYLLKNEVEKIDAI